MKTSFLVYRAIIEITLRLVAANIAAATAYIAAIYLSKSALIRAEIVSDSSIERFITFLPGLNIYFLLIFFIFYIPSIIYPSHSGFFKRFFLIDLILALCLLTWTALPALFDYNLGYEIYADYREAIVLNGKITPYGHEVFLFDFLRTLGFVAMYILVALSLRMILSWNKGG